MSDERFKKDDAFALPEGDYLWLPEDAERALPILAQRMKEWVDAEVVRRHTEQAPND